MQGATLREDVAVNLRHLTRGGDMRLESRPAGSDSAARGAEGDWPEPVEDHPEHTAVGIVAEG